MPLLPFMPTILCARTFAAIYTQPKLPYTSMLVIISGICPPTIKARTIYAIVPSVKGFIILVADAIINFFTGLSGIKKIYGFDYSFTQSPAALKKNCKYEHIIVVPKYIIVVL